MRQATTLWIGLLSSAAVASGAEPLKSRVVRASDPQAVHLFEADSTRVEALLQRAMRALTNQEDSAAAWQRFVQPTDVVGIKIAAGRAPLLGTHRALVHAIVSDLQRSGVPAQNIILWDRFASDLIAAGYSLRDRPGDVRVLATTPGEGGDPDVYYSLGLVGKPVWGDFAFLLEEVSDRSHVSRIVTQRLTKIVNVPVLTEHRDSGLAGCLFHLAIGSVDHTLRFAAAPWRYDPAIAEILALEVFHQKTVLHILDALTPQFAGGPSQQPRYVWHAGTLFVSTDPVAVDTLALEAIEAKRREHGLPSVAERARHIASAAELELGENRREFIEVVEP